jgi:prepilin-type N-terminal cleavage/methylation domain-containing protein/prepilin-type processing-associated H-X9-DG protein
LSFGLSDESWMSLLHSEPGSPWPWFSFGTLGGIETMTHQDRPWLEHMRAKGRSSFILRRHKAFTLIELLVVIASIATLAALLLPALAAGGPRSLAVLDMNNKRELQLAWTMYASDTNDRLVQNADQSVTVNGNQSWIPPLNVMTWSSSPYNTNVTLLMTNVLGPYCSGQYTIYTSPGDHYLSPIQRALGYGARADHRCRSVAMDAAVGGDARNHPADSGQTGYKPPPSLPSLNPFFFATKRGQLMHPNNSWVFLDEDPDSIDDGIFYIDPRTASGSGTLIEAPASYLGGACGISFADGHAEVHRWVTSALNHKVSYSKYPAGPGLILSSNADLAWLAQRTPSAP